MNICFFSGIVRNEIELRFIYDRKKKSLGKKHICIVVIELELYNKQTIMVHAYDEKADWIYQNISKNNRVLISGKIKESYIELEEIEVI